MFEVTVLFLGFSYSNETGRTDKEIKLLEYGYKSLFNVPIG